MQKQKALAAPPSMLALTDQDEAWGKWRPSDSRSSKDAVPSTFVKEETEPHKAGSAGVSFS